MWKEEKRGKSLSEGLSSSPPARSGEPGGPENVAGSSCSVPDICQGDVQSGIGEVGTRGGPSLSSSGAGGWRLPGTGASGGDVSDTASSKGSKMRGSPSDDIVPSVDSSGDSAAAVSAASAGDVPRVEAGGEWRDVQHTQVISEEKEVVAFGLKPL